MHEESLHPPAPAEPRRVLPQPALLVRGIGLAGIVVFALMVARAFIRLSAWCAPLSLISVGVAFLAAWGAAVALTGGEKVDDHPWV